ncbi:uncharacterized protein LOC122509106 isoform X3 [Leptopilina heterotoma]|uniref:uncharacterized protein LOC122509106 isoform X3 n=1 Tax=Leptopilina heterotoma TaxID=63436 RepID=UPI001CA97B9E|nr:uncharacterized protein LOC122509106 isoform X3 [Leptopilina heterotoma]
MGAEMRLLRFTKLLLLLLIATTVHTRDTEDASSINTERIRPARIERDLDGDYQYELDDREKYNRYQENSFAQDKKLPNDPTNSFGVRVQDSDDYEKLTDERQRKRVRIRVPVVRSRNGKQFARTVVRRRPIAPYTRSVAPLEVSSHSPRRIVVTRVRPRGPAHTPGYANELTNVDYQSYENVRQNSDYGTHDNYRPSDFDEQFDDLEKRKEFQPSEFGRHKVTITRRRKISPATASVFQRERVTRKKLVSVRPIPQPSPTLAIITTGFFTIPSEDDEEEEYSDEEDETPIDELRHFTPKLHDTPNIIENKPLINKDIPEISKIEDSDKPIIITDNFFFPVFQDDDDDDDDDEGYDGDVDDDDNDSDVGARDDRTKIADVPNKAFSKDEPNDDTRTVSENSNKQTDHSKMMDDDKDRDNAGKNEREENSTSQDRKTSEKADAKEDTKIAIDKDKSTGAGVVETDHVVTEDGSISKTYYGTTDTATDRYTTKVDEATESPPTTTAPTTTPTPEENLYPTTSEPPPTTSEVTENSSKDVQSEVRTESTQIDDSKSETESTPLETTESTTTEQTSASIKDLPEVTDQPTSTDIEPSSPQPKVIADTSSTPKTTEDSLTVKPLETFVQQEEPSTPSVDPSPQTETGYFTDFDDADIPSVIPLDTEYILESSQTIISSHEKSRSIAQVTTTFTSPTPEDIEAGLADDLYLSLSRPDFPEILPSKPLFDSVSPTSDHSGSVIPTPALKTSVYYTETIVTSTRLRTYTYVVTKLNGLETEVTSSTTVRPRVTTLTLTVPITVTVTPTAELTSSLAPSDNNPEIVTEYTGKEDDGGSEGEGRKFNLATRVMSNGVEVIVAGPTPALRWENSNSQPTLTLSDAVVMLLPQEKPNEFVTKTCTTTFTYLSTITKDGVTIVSTDQQVVANTATEERHRKPASEAAAYTLEASPTLETEVFKTTYTYLTLNTDHPDEKNALESSVRVITNTVTAPKYYLDMILEPSEAPRPETNTYLSTRVLEKTITEDGRTRIQSTSDTVTQLIITESAPPPRPISVETTLTALDENESPSPDITKTYYITYTYFNTFLEKDSTVIKTNVATSTDYVLEKAPKKTSIKLVPANQTPDPIQIYATKTYLTTFTYFTTLLQAGLDGKTATTISSRSQIVENVVTESIAPSLLEAGYMNALLTTSQHSDPVNNVVTGSTIIFFDDDEQTQPTSTSLQDTLATASHENPVQVPESSEILSSNVHSNSESEESISPEEQESSIQEEIVPPENVDDSDQNKRPTVLNSDLQVSNLLNLGSLGINSLSALGPVITAMAGLLQGKTANRRNDTSPIPPGSVPVSEAPDTTTLRSPIYIPVADFADGDIETAESQNVAHILNVNHNHIPETRHKVTASLADGIPISPGEVITANSDVIIGKPGKMGPRPPEKFLNDDEHIGMKPPPMSVPNIPVHPVLEVVEDNRDNFKHKEISHIGNIPLEIIPAHQIYEEHIKVPIRYPLNPPKRPHPLQPLLPPPKRISSKHDILENDPLLRPPERPIEKYPQKSENDSPKYPWNPKEPLTPSMPTSVNKMQTDSSKTKSWIEDHQSWPQDKLYLKPSEFSQNSDSSLSLTEPIVHQVPHVIDRGTGQPLLVNLQPSQVANVVIPQGGTQALIFGDTNEPHISGQYFDDPSPYPESEVGPTFTSISKGENIQYPTDEVNYMIPPPPKNYKPVTIKPGNTKKPHVIPLSQTHGHQDYIKPHGTSILRPVERYPVRRPEVPGTPAGQGHVHTEILVHHKPESVNLRPQPVSHRPHPFPIQQLPPRRDFNKVKKPIEITPPRRTEVSLPTEKPQEFAPSTNLDTGNEVSGNKNWKLNQKPLRTSLTRRPRPTFKPRYPTRGRPVIKKPPYITNQRLPLKPPTNVDQSNSFANTQILNTSVEKQKIDFPYNIVPNNEHSMNIDNSQINQQNTVPNFFANGEKPGATNSQTERTDEYIPTGAVEYKNPSSEQQIKNTGNQYYAPYNGEESNKPVSDSESADSDPVKFATPIEFDKGQSETSMDSSNNEDKTNRNQNVYKKPQEVNEKPVDSNSHVVFQYPSINNGHDLRNQYGVRPYDMPIIQGKPFGVYGVKNHDNRAPIYGNVQGSFSYAGSKGHDDTIDLKPPAIIPQFEPNGHSRPYGRPDGQPGIYQQPEIITKPPSKTSRPDQSDFILFGEGHMQPGPGQVISVNAEPDWSINHNRSKTQSLGRPNLEKPLPKPTPTYIGISRPEIGSGVRIHPDYPHIITKPKIRVPGPITISSGSSKPVDNTHKRPQFSLPIEAIGDEEDSKTQTERPPSSLVKKPSKEPTDETLETAFQTNFASSDSKEDAKDTSSDGSQRKGIPTTMKPKVPSQNMMPPPRTSSRKPTDQKTDNQEGVKTSLKSTEVVGLSPPPVDITTTNRPADSKITTLNESGLRPPPLFIPLKDSVSKAGTISSPSNKMVPPSPRPTHIRPFLADILSEDMVPPPPIKTSKPIEIATVRPVVAVSGSIQIASAVATSHIPVIQDVESKIPIIHGTVDLPVVVDVPEILRPVETKKAEHVSIYTARPFETKQTTKISIQPSVVLTTNLVIPTATVQVEASKSPVTESSTTSTVIVSRKHSKRPDHPVFLEPSMDNILPSTTKLESTETLSYPVKPEHKERRPTSIHRESVTKIRKPFRPHLTRHHIRNNTDNRVVYSIATKVESSVRKATPTIIKPKDVPQFMKGESIEIIKEIIGTVEEHEVMDNRSNSNKEMKPKESIPASYENEASDDSIDSIFVVMSDQKPPEPGAEEVEAEYGEEISRDEQDPAGNEIHRVLAGGILGAPVIPLHPVVNQCVPECRAFKAEMCAEFSGEMRCVCRPGFARMFPDRPCKPTYTYTLRVGLDRIGRDNVLYTDNMNDTTSHEYRRLAPNVKEALDRTLMQSDLRDLYQGVKIAGFVPEPVQVKFHVYLFDNANGTHLKEIIRKYLVNSNYSLGGTEVYASRNLSLVVAEDFDECTTVEDGWSHHDCSMNAVCFNLPGSYQCSCKEGWADLSENPAYPGRLCSQAPLGCSACNNKGHCVLNSHGHNTCECFPWHSGQKCQINLKVLLIALVTTGAVLLGLLAVCVSLACFRHPGRRRSSGDRRAMIPGAGTGGDTSSEGSVAELAIPHHVPHVLPPPPQMLAPAPPVKRPIRKPSNRLRHHARKVMPVVPPIAIVNTEQRDRSLTVMIPRAKYRSAPQSTQPTHKSAIKSTFSVEEHKLIDYLEGGIHPGIRKPTPIINNDCKEAEIRVKKSPISPTGALVSAGFQVSATVTRTVDAESALARSCGETTVEPATKILRSNDFQGDIESSLARSCTETTIQTSANQLLRLDMLDTGSTLARSCGETTILPSTKIANSDRKDNRDARDSTSEGHTMAERDLGSTLRLPAQHAQLYNSDRANSDRESNFDSL